MRILGIDPGTAITGFGVIDTTKNKQVIVDAGVIRTEANTELAGRLLKIYESLQELLQEFKPEQVAVEKLYFARNVTTAISVSHARGVVLLAAAERGLAVAEYTPLQVKQAVTGYGQADKKQVQEMVKTILGLKEVPKPDDAADALAVAICHATSVNSI